MTVLVVVAHPDDEVLGAGGTVAGLTEAGIECRSCLVVAGADVRAHRPRSDALHSDLLQANELLGLRPPVLGEFPNIRLNTVPHLDLVQFIEKAISDTGATTLFTHHPRDMNDDHRHVSFACQAAARLFQRCDDVTSLVGLYFMEILSSTDWSFPGNGAPFEPDTFFEIGEDGFRRKLDALKAYRGVMRPFPHPRSEEALHGLASYRGGQAGLHLAEGFQTAFRRAGTNSRF